VKAGKAELAVRLLDEYEFDGEGALSADRMPPRECSSAGSPDAGAWLAASVISLIDLLAATER
jgi:hypothetical protein